MDFERLAVSASDARVNSELNKQVRTPSTRPISTLEMLSNVQEACRCYNKQLAVVEDEGIVLSRTRGLLFSKRCPLLSSAQSSLALLLLPLLLHLRELQPRSSRSTNTRTALFVDCDVIPRIRDPSRDAQWIARGRAAPPRLRGIRGQIDVKLSERITLCPLCGRHIIEKRDGIRCSGGGLRHLYTIVFFAVPSSSPCALRVIVLPRAPAAPRFPAALFHFHMPTGITRGSRS